MLILKDRLCGLLLDTREEHKTEPETLWFVAATNKNRVLKIIYISDGKSIYLKSAYQASPDIIRIYEKYTDVADAWEPQSESGMGQNEQYVKRAGAEYEASLDDTLALQMISIRLQKKLIEDLKVIARANGIGYQPLIRDILSRFARSETQNIMRDAISRKQLEAEHVKIKSRA